jgi:hypothetical protein
MDAWINGYTGASPQKGSYIVHVGVLLNASLKDTRKQGFLIWGVIQPGACFLRKTAAPAPGYPRGAKLIIAISFSEFHTIVLHRR